jgi:NADPH:quinone reductase-like Zn-dependent oxidoreductase
MNQTAAGFAFPALAPERIAESLPSLLDLIRHGKVRIFAEHSFPLSQASIALEALLSLKTIGKVVLTP